MKAYSCSISLFGNISDRFRGKYSTMPEVEISVKGVAKLLYNLNIAKAAGPDEIKPVVLKELSLVIVPAIASIFLRPMCYSSRVEESTSLPII